MIKDNDISWPTVFAASLLTGGVCVGVTAAVASTWLLMALAGICVLAGFGFLALGWRD